MKSSQTFIKSIQNKQQIKRIKSDSFSLNIHEKIKEEIYNANIKKFFNQEKFLMNNNFDKIHSEIFLKEKNKALENIILDDTLTNNESSENSYILSAINKIESSLSNSNNKRSSIKHEFNLLIKEINKE